MQVSQSFGNAGAVTTQERRDIPLKCVKSVFFNYPETFPNYVLIKRLGNNIVFSIPDVGTSCIHNLYALANLFSGTSEAGKIQRIFNTVISPQIEFEIPKPTSGLIKIRFCNQIVPLLIQSLQQFRKCNKVYTRKHVFEICSNNQSVIRSIVEKILSRAQHLYKEEETGQQWISKAFQTYGYYFNKSCFKSFRRTLQQNQTNVSDDKHFIYYVSIKLKKTFLHAFVIEQIPGEQSAKYRIYQTCRGIMTGKKWLESSGYLDTKPYMSEKDFAAFETNLEIFLFSTKWTVESEQAYLACFGTHNPLLSKREIYSYNPELQEFEGLGFQYLVDSFKPEDVQNNLNIIVQEMTL